MSKKKHKKKPHLEEVFLTASDLVHRWKQAITQRTLSNWRYNNDGPRFTKVGGKVLYRLADVEDYERRRTSR